MSSVNGKVALITGGANGVGAEVARRLHDKGAKLVLTDLDETLLKEVAARLGEDRVETVVADVRDLSAMQSAVEKGVERFGGIDIVMANAGIAVFGSVLNVDPEAFKTLSSRWGESTMTKGLTERVTQMDEESAALGRSMSARTEALEKP